LSTYNTRTFIPAWLDLKGLHRILREGDPSDTTTALDKHNQALPFKAFPPLVVGDAVVGSGETGSIKSPVAADGTFAVVIAGLQTFPVKSRVGYLCFLRIPALRDS
jgi:hypothetical protein